MKKRKGKKKEIEKNEGMEGWEKEQRSSGRGKGLGEAYMNCGGVHMAKCLPSGLVLYLIIDLFSVYN